MDNETNQNPATIHAVLLWDWKESATKIAKDTARACKGGKEATEFCTGSDDICFVVANRQLTDEEAEAAYDAWSDMVEEDGDEEAFFPHQLKA